MRYLKTLSAEEFLPFPCLKIPSIQPQMFVCKKSETNNLAQLSLYSTKQCQYLSPGRVYVSIIHIPGQQSYLQSLQEGRFETPFQVLGRLTPFCNPATVKNVPDSFVDNSNPIKIGKYGKYWEYIKFVTLILCPVTKIRTIK